MKKLRSKRHFNDKINLFKKEKKNAGVTLVVLVK